MNYKVLFRQVVALLAAPGKAWDGIAECGGNGGVVVTTFVYPLIGLCGLATFVGSFLGAGMNADIFQAALTHCCAVAVALFGGYFLAVYLMREVARRWLGETYNQGILQSFVGYSMVVTFVLDIFNALMSVELLRWFLQLYTVVVVFEGVRCFLKVREEKQTSFTVLATLVIWLCPAVIGFVFNKLSVILN